MRTSGKIVSAVAVAIAGLTLLTWIVKADPKGYCSKEPYTSTSNRYLSDDEYIKEALLSGYRGKITKDPDVRINEKDIEKFMQLYPDCCSVHRESDDKIKVHNSIFDRAVLGRQTVVVRVRSIASVEALREGKSAKEEDTLLVMSACGQYLGGH